MHGPFGKTAIDDLGMISNAHPKTIDTIKCPIFENMFGFKLLEVFHYDSTKVKFCAETRS